MDLKLNTIQTFHVCCLKKIFTIMRLTTIFFMITIFCASAEIGHSQVNNISLHLENVTLEEALNEIRQKGDYSFWFRNEEINLNKKVSIQVENKEINQVLDNLLANENLGYLIEDKHIIIFKKDAVMAALQQQQNRRQVTGTVTDERGEPIIGANVVERETTNGVITDIDGKFTLFISENSILQISYIGYITQELTVKNQTNISIILKEDAQTLNEVVVVGYGMMKKSDLTGAIVRADIEQLQESPSIGIAEMLQGVVPGLNVGAVANAGTTPSISIRGRNSISGSTSPLIVLDGIIYRGNIVDINPNDVASIDVLKDASSAAIYGSQASNGVILITTKIGTEQTKPIIEYSGSFSIQEVSNKKMKVLDRQGFLDMIGDRFLEESRTGQYLDQPNPKWDVSSHFMDRTTLDGYNNGIETDWWDLLTNDTPSIQSHNVSVRGKSNLSSYFFSVGLTDQENLIINDTYKRYNVRVNLDTKVTNWLKVGVQSFFTVSDYSGVSPTLAGIVTLPPIVAPYDEEGNLVKNPYKTMDNPLLQIEQDNVQKRYNLSANFYVDVDIPYIEGLNYRLNAYQNLITDKNFNYNAQGENFTGTASKVNAEEYVWSVDNLLTYKRTFDEHAINATLVYGAERRTYETTSANARTFVDGTLGYNNLGLGRSDLQSVSSGAWKESSLYTMFRLNYVYNDRYMLTGTIRRDGFSGFGSNNKFGVFPSLSVAWRLSEENFLNSYDWLDNLKLRVSYGTNGNRTVGRYQTLAKMGMSSGGYLYGDNATAEPSQWVSALSNSDLKWETTNTLNVGVDFSFLNGRLYGAVEYYHSNTKNLLYDINIPTVNGFSSIASNIGKLKNNGQELSITGVPVKNKDFSWNVTFNFSRNRNKVVSILGIDADGDGKEDDLVSSKIFIGKPYGVCYDYNITGMWQMQDHVDGNIPAGFRYGTYKVEDINQDGKYSADQDRKILGYTDPAYRFSILNTLNYKNWEFKFLINSIQGGKNRYLGQPGSDVPNPENIYQNNFLDFDYWTPENPNARYRQIGNYTEVFGESFTPYVQRSFVRLQDVTLSYNFPQSLINKLDINRLKVYITAKNLFTITDWDGWDPELGAGINRHSYPLMRNYSIGVNLEF